MRVYDRRLWNILLSIGYFLPVVCLLHRTDTYALRLPPKICERFPIGNLSFFIIKSSRIPILRLRLRIRIRSYHNPIQAD